MGRNQKKLFILTILALLVQMALLCGAAYAADLTINVEADKYIDESGEGGSLEVFQDGYTGDGLENMLAAGHDNMYGNETAVLRFDLSGIVKTVESAKLKINIIAQHTDDGDPLTGAVDPFITVSGSSDGDTWAEGDLTIPAGVSLTTETVIAGDVGTWKEFNVTAFVTAAAAGDKKATFILNGPTSGQWLDTFFYDRAKEGFGAKLEITYANTAPVLAAIGNKTAGEGSLLTFTASASDADLPANTLTYSLEGAPAGAAINGTTGVFTWTPTEAQGPENHTFTVKVTDDGTPNLSDSEDITVTVNEVNTAPVLAAIGNKTVDEGSLLSFTASASDADLPANTLTYGLVGAPAGASIVPATGAFSWTPAEAQSPGNYTFTVKVADGGSPSLS